jgi:hypothetical protein
MAGLRQRREEKVAAERLPADARHVVVDGVRGWLYALTDATGDAYELFAYFDGGGYQVRVVTPDVFGRTDHHQAHLFPDGRICLGPDGVGMATLGAAFARSAAWAHGFSVYRRTTKFPY